MNMPMTVSPKQITLAALLFAVVSAVLAVVVVYRHTILEAVSINRQFSFSIASDPSGADAILNGKPIGKTPLMFAIEPGQHVIELRKEGFQDTSRAFYAAYVSSKWYEAVQNLNVELRKRDGPPLKPASVPQVAPSNSPAIGTRIDPATAKELRELRSMILANPEESVTVTAIQERMRLQAEELKGLREDLKEVKEQSKWLIGIVVAVVLGLLAAVIAVLQAFPQNGKA